MDRMNKKEIQCNTILLKYTASTYSKDSRYGVGHTTPLGATFVFQVTP